MILSWSAVRARMELTRHLRTLTPCTQPSSWATLAATQHTLAHLLERRQSDDHIVALSHDPRVQQAALLLKHERRAYHKALQLLRAA